MNNNKYFDDDVFQTCLLCFFKNWSNYYDFIHKAKSPYIYLPIYFISILENFKNLLFNSYLKFLA